MFTSTIHVDNRMAAVIVNTKSFPMRDNIHDYLAGSKKEDLATTVQYLANKHDCYIRVEMEHATAEAIPSKGDIVYRDLYKKLIQECQPAIDHVQIHNDHYGLKIGADILPFICQKFLETELRAWRQTKASGSAVMSTGYQMTFQVNAPNRHIEVQLTSNDPIDFAMRESVERMIKNSPRSLLSVLAKAICEHLGLTCDLSEIQGQCVGVARAEWK